MCLTAAPAWYRRKSLICRQTTRHGAYIGPDVQLRQSDVLQVQCSSLGSLVVTPGAVRSTSASDIQLFFRWAHGEGARAPTVLLAFRRDDIRKLSRQRQSCRSDDGPF